VRPLSTRFDLRIDGLPLAGAEAGLASPFSPLLKDLFGLAIVPLLRGQIANSAMIGLGLALFIGHLDPVIREDRGHLRGLHRAKESFVAKGLLPGLLHGLHRGFEAQVLAHNLPAENIDDGK